MDDLTHLFAPFGLRLAVGPLELTYLRDDDLPALAALAAAGIHGPDEMPFPQPWSTLEPDALARALAQYYWRERSDFSPQRWTLSFAVRREGVLVGTQALEAEHFAVTRTVETTSWLGRAHQGRGTGTAMRRAVCALAFDHLGAARVTSSAFVDNPASLAVSRAVGYRENGRTWRTRRPDECAEQVRLVLDPDSFVRGEPVAVEGVAAVRSLIGLG